MLTHYICNHWDTNLAHVLNFAFSCLDADEIIFEKWNSLRALEKRFFDLHSISTWVPLFVCFFILTFFQDYLGFCLDCCLTRDCFSYHLL